GSIVMMSAYVIYRLYFKTRSRAIINLVRVRTHHRRLARRQVANLQQSQDELAGKYGEYGDFKKEKPYVMKGQGRLQHLSPLPHHAPAKDRLPGSSPAFLVRPRAEARFRTLHEAPRRARVSYGVGGEGRPRIPAPESSNWATWATGTGPAIP